MTAHRGSHPNLDPSIITHTRAHYPLTFPRPAYLWPQRICPTNCLSPHEQGRWVEAWADYTNFSAIRLLLTTSLRKKVIPSRLNRVISTFSDVKPETKQDQSQSPLVSYSLSLNHFGRVSTYTTLWLWNLCPSRLPVMTLQTPCSLNRLWVSLILYEPSTDQVRIINRRDSPRRLLMCSSSHPLTWVVRN